MEKKCSSSCSGGGLADGLKFGKKIYFEGQPKTGASPAKKGRTAAVQGGQPPRCQVEGCRVDLSDAKTYYSRHKVCGMHSKSPKVIVAGIEQRFCQQCSRFHLLHEFDQGKRSCRRRLAGHNERRRKPPPGSLLSARCRTICQSMFDDYSRTGGFMMDFGAHSNIAGRDSWPNATSERVLENQADATGKSQFTWQYSSQNNASDLLHRSNYSGQGVSSKECYTGVSDSNSALSLLSNQLWGSKNSSSGFGVSNYLCTSETMLVEPSINPGAAVGQFGFPPSWVLKDNQASEMPPDLGLGQTSHHASSQYCDELGLAQPSEEEICHLEQSRNFDSSGQHMHWSL